MRKVDLIICNAAEILTCAAGNVPKKGLAMRAHGLIKNGAVAIKDGVIAAAAATDEILNNYFAEHIIEAAGKTVTPGFVECHTHIVYAGNRFDEFEMKISGIEYLEILEQGGGILSTVRATRQADLQSLIDCSSKRLDKMLAFGITTCEIKTGYGLDTVNELKMLEAIFQLDRIHPVDIVPTFLPAHTVPPEFRTVEHGADQYVELILDEMLPMAHKLNREQTNGKPIFADVFCEKNAFNVAQSRKILEAALSYGFGIKAHADEFTNLGASKMAINLGATSIDHLDLISAEEIKMLAASNTIGVITPTVNFNFGSRDFADARKMIEAGCAIAVSTDYNPGSAPCPSLPNALAMACRYQKMMPSEAFNAATINAAFAVGLGQTHGSLEAGKKADLIIFETRDHREIVYEFGGNFAAAVIKNGRVVRF